MSRHKLQESPEKSKFAEPPGDLRKRTDSDLSQTHEKTVAEISMRDFLDFLKISYQVNEAIDNPSCDVTEKGCVDWKKLTSDALIGRLKEREALLSKQKTESLNAEPKEKPLSADASRVKKSRKSLEEKTGENLTGSFSTESLNSVVSYDRKSAPDKLGLGRRKPHGLKKDGSTESETSRSIDSTDERTPARQLKKKLNEVLQEGLLDSVLPYLLPKHSTQEHNTAAKKPESKKPASGNSEKNEKSFVGSAKGKDLKKKSLCNSDCSDKQDKKDVEVVIHVCDEIKNLKRDFKCSQKLLLSQMGYFSEVTTGQKLEDMDISVHCDVYIFEWLMKWVQKDSLSEDHWPILDPAIAVPVLMSSAFLQMNSLFEHCLRYCKKEINNVIRDSPNLGCLNDNVLTRLAGLFSNTEVDKIVDKKDKIQSKLFCKLIVALTDPKPQPSKGHFSSLATIYRCSKCLKLILKNLSSSIVCVTSNLKMDRYGTLHSIHVYDSSWNLTDYIRDLKQTLKSWQKVYWRLWADCHFLFCHACDEYFPVGQMSWCRYHVDSIQYFPVENQRSVFHSIGRYPCCGERIYRFETVKKISGCHYRDHVVTSKNTKDAEILRLWNFHKEMISIDPPPLPQPENKKTIKTMVETGTCKKSPVKEGFWWEGLEIVPVKQSRGLLNKVWDSVIKREEPKNAGSLSENKIQKVPVSRGFISQQSQRQDNSSLSDSSDDSSSSSNAANSEESCHSTKVVAKSKNSTLYNIYNVPNRLSYIKKERKRRKKKKKRVIVAKNEGNRFWLSKLSTRCNQDNQREFEERALKQIESNLAKKLSGESFLEKRTVGMRSNYQAVPLGGIYVKLEQDWREAHCYSHGCPGSSIKARGSASHVNVNNSSYAVQKRSKSRGHR